MSIQFRVEVSGIEGFAEKMRMLDENTQETVQNALNSVGQLVAGRARDLAPVRTGRLMQGIYAQIIYRWVVKVGCIVPYALFQELGTRFISPRYFLTRALAESSSDFMFVVSAALERAAEETGSI